MCTSVKQLCMILSFFYASYSMSMSLQELPKELITSIIHFAHSPVKEVENADLSIHDIFSFFDSADDEWKNSLKGTMSLFLSSKVMWDLCSREIPYLPILFILREKWQTSYNIPHKYFGIKGNLFLINRTFTTRDNEQNVQNSVQLKIKLGRYNINEKIYFNVFIIINHQKRMPELYSIIHDKWKEKDIKGMILCLQKYFTQEKNHKKIQTIADLVECFFPAAIDNIHGTEGKQKCRLYIKIPTAFFTFTLFKQFVAVQNSD